MLSALLSALMISAQIPFADLAQETCNNGIQHYGHGALDGMDHLVVISNDMKPTLSTTM